MIAASNAGSRAHGVRTVRTATIPFATAGVESGREACAARAPAATAAAMTAESSSSMSSRSTESRERRRASAASVSRRSASTSFRGKAVARVLEMVDARFVVEQRVLVTVTLFAAA